MTLPEIVVTRPDGRGVRIPYEATAVANPGFKEELGDVVYHALTVSMTDPKPVEVDDAPDDDQPEPQNDTPEEPTEDDPSQPQEDPQ